MTIYIKIKDYLSERRYITEKEYDVYKLAKFGDVEAIEYFENNNVDLLSYSEDGGEYGSMIYYFNDENNNSFRDAEQYEFDAYIFLQMFIDDDKCDGIKKRKVCESCPFYNSYEPLGNLGKHFCFGTKDAREHFINKCKKMLDKKYIVVENHEHKKICGDLKFKIIDHVKERRELNLTKYFAYLLSKQDNPVALEYINECRMEIESYCEDDGEYGSACFYFSDKRVEKSRNIKPYERKAYLVLQRLRDNGYCIGECDKVRWEKCPLHGIRTSVDGSFSSCIRLSTIERRSKEILKNKTVVMV